MKCELCGREVTGEIFVRTGELAEGIPVVSLESTPNRNWICCDSCNILLCHQCCGYPESGYCDTCIQKYDLLGYLISGDCIKRGSP